MKILTRLAFLTFVCVLPIAIKAQTQPPSPTRLHEVQSIYIEDFGGFDEAARFKLLIEGELSNKGFKIAPNILLLVICKNQCGERNHCVKSPLIHSIGGFHLPLALRS